jgi:hypothetical protein
VAAGGSGGGLILGDWQAEGHAGIVFLGWFQSIRHGHESKIYPFNFYP